MICDDQKMRFDEMTRLDEEFLLVSSFRWSFLNAASSTEMMKRSNLLYIVD